MKKRLLPLMLSLTIAVGNNTPAFASEELPMDAVEEEFSQETISDETEVVDEEVTSEEDSADSETKDPSLIEDEIESSEKESEEALEEISEDDSLLSAEPKEETTEFPDYYYTEFPTSTIYADVEYDFSATEDSDMNLYSTRYIPESYRNINVTTIKDQSPYGSCWAFASTTLAEANLIKKGMDQSPDLSELHLAYFNWNIVDDGYGSFDGEEITHDNPARILDYGGSFEGAAYTYSKWMGAADEDVANYKRDAYHSTVDGLQDEIAYESSARLKNLVIKPYRTSAGITTTLSDIEGVKELIMDYGAAGMYFYAVNSVAATINYDYYNPEYNCYYDPDDTGLNHAVTVVGWDDNFPKENFVKTPRGDGAWLVRNSWSDGDVENYTGYFWMSYYNRSIGKYFYAFDMTNDPDEMYDRNHQYDSTFGFTYDFTSNSSEFPYASNIAMIDTVSENANEVLKAVSFFSTGSGSYTLSIYSNLTDTEEPTSGTLEAQLDCSIDGPGFHTYKLPSSIELTAGSDFSVVMIPEFTVTSERLLYTVGYNYARKASGHFYHLDRTEKWYPNEERDFSLHIYSDFHPADGISVTDLTFNNITDDNIVLKVNSTFMPSVSIAPANATDKTVTWTSDDTNVATVSSRGMIVAKTPGIAHVTATCGNISKTITVDVRMRLNAMNVALLKSSVVHGETRYLNEGYRLDIDPVNYTSSTAPVWTSSDPSVLEVTDTSWIAHNIGTVDVTVTWDGITTTKTIDVGVAESDFTVDISDNNVVTIEWPAVDKAKYYEIFENGRQITLIEPVAGRTKYTYIVDKYKDQNGHDVDDRNLKYTFVVSKPHYQKHTSRQSYSRAKTVRLNAWDEIIYHVFDGIQNELNPNWYINGREYELYDPIPPAGYSFDGWYDEPDCQRDNQITQISFDDTGTMDLYALYLRPTYTVSFETFGGTAIDPVTLPKDEELTLPADPVKEGYVFEGWYLNEECDNDFLPEEPPRGDYTLYALFIPLPTDIILEGYKTQIAPGETLTLKAFIYPEGTWQQLKYQRIINPPGIAQVTQNGNTIVVKAGNRNGTITFELGSPYNTNLKKHFVIKVQTPEPEDVVITSPSGESESILETGQSVTLSAAISPAEVSQDVTWSTSDSNVAFVANGSVTAMAPGVAYISAAAKENPDIKTSYRVIVTKPRPVSAKELRILDASKTPKLYGSSSETPETTLYGSVANGDPANINISDNGNVYELALGIGNTVTLKADFLPKVVKKSGKKTTYVNSVADTAAIWSSNDASVADINKSGKVTAKSPGTALITLSDSVRNVQASCYVTVYPPATSVTLDKTSVTVGRGDTVKLNAVKIMPASAMQDVTWSVSGKQGIATVDEDGTVHAIANGTTTVVATAMGGKSAKCTVKVGNPVTNVEITNAPEKLAAGKSVTLKTVLNDKAKAQPVDKSIVWSIVSGQDAATISPKGVLKGIGGGQVTVHATSGLDERYYDDVLIDVYVPLKKAALKKSSATISVGGTYTIVPVITSAINTNDASGMTGDSSVLEEITWQMANPGYGDSIHLHPNEDGSCDVTGLAPVIDPAEIIGEFTPYGSTKPVQLSFKLTVTSDQETANKIKLSKSSLKIAQGCMDSLSIETDIAAGSSHLAEIETNAPGITFYDAKTGKYENTGRFYQSGEPVVIHVAEDVPVGTYALLITNQNTSVTAKLKVTAGASDFSLSYDGEEIKDDFVKVAVGKTITISASTTNAAKKVSAPITWVSEDPSIATVSSKGVIKGIKNGTTNVTASLNGRNDESITFEVRVHTLPTKVTLDRTKILMATQKGDDSYNQYEMISADIAPSEVYTNWWPGDNEVTWTVSDPSILQLAKVSTDLIKKANTVQKKQQELAKLTYKSGAVTTIGGLESLAMKALKPGQVKITATVPGGKKAECTVTVYTHVSDLSFEAPVTKKVNKKNVVVLNESMVYDYVAEMNAKTVKKLQLTPHVSYDGAAYGDTDWNIAKKYAVNSNVTYTSSDSSVATISASGAITAKKKGMTIIRAVTQDGGIVKTIRVVVN